MYTLIRCCSTRGYCKRVIIFEYNSSCVALLCCCSILRKASIVPITAITTSSLIIATTIRSTSIHTDEVVLETFCVPLQILHHTNFCQSSMRGLGNTMLVHGRMFFVERLRRFAPRPSTGRFAPYGPTGLPTWQGPLVIEVRLRLPHRSATRSAWSVALLKVCLSGEP